MPFERVCKLTKAKKQSCFFKLDTNCLVRCAIFLYYQILRLLNLVLSSMKWSLPKDPKQDLRVFIGVETAALAFRTKQHSTSCSSHLLRQTIL